MTTTAMATPTGTRQTYRWAMVSGISGIVANIVLILFFVLVQPYGAANERFGWLGPVNDAIIVVQFTALIPVTLALRNRLPASRSVRRSTAMGAAAMGAVILLQLLLIIRLLRFEIQVILVCAAFAVIFSWVLSVSRIGYRTGALPHRVARFGLFLGLSLPLGLLVLGIGLLIPEGVAARYIPLALGVAIGAIGWLAFPAWPLLLARLVFRKEQEFIEEES